jgi:hypothetical protein
MGAGGSSAAKDTVKNTPKRENSNEYAAQMGENTFLLLGK